MLERSYLRRGAAILLMIAAAVAVPKLSAAEDNIRETDDTYVVSVWVERTVHGRNVAERQALDIAQRMLASWLQIRHLRWPSDIEDEDKAFLLNIYERVYSSRFEFGQAQLAKVKENGARYFFSFNIFKKGMWVEPIYWAELFGAVTSYAREGGSSPLVHLELADRFPKAVPHSGVVGRIRAEIGPNFLKFLTNADVTRMTRAPKLTRVPDNPMQLARLLNEYPYNIELALLLAGELRKENMTRVMCRVINASQRGDKLSPAYPALRDFGREECAGRGSYFVDGVSDSQIARMSDESRAIVPEITGVASQIVASFGELPLIPSQPAAAEAVIALQGCPEKGLEGCLIAFNQCPSGLAAAHIASLLNQRGRDFVANAFRHQAWVWKRAANDHNAPGYQGYPASSPPK